MTAVDRAGSGLPTVTGGLKWTRHPPAVLAAWVAEMDYATAPPVRDAVEAAVRRGAFGYPDDRSRQDLACACADWLGRAHGWRVAPEQVYLLPDVLHGVQVAIEEHSPADSPVILPVPGYPPLADAVRVCRRPLFEVPMTIADGRPTLDLDAVDRAFAAGARTLVLCNPHNPLGTVAEPRELHALAAVVDRHGGRVVADEIHSPLVFPGHRHVPYASLSKTAAHHTVTLVSAKGWNIAGLKCAQAIVTHERDRALWSALPTVRTWGAGLFGVLASEAAYRLGGPWLAGGARPGREPAAARGPAGRAAARRPVPRPRGHLPGLAGFPRPPTARRTGRVPAAGGQGGAQRGPPLRRPRGGPRPAEPRHLTTDSRTARTGHGRSGGTTSVELTVELNLVRYAWHTAEPVHAVIYYAPETRAATGPLELPGRWMWYFGCRAAPLGAVGAATATSVFFHLAPAMVSRSVPALWQHASPDDFLRVRHTAVDAALRRLLGPLVNSPGLARAAELATVAASVVDGEGGRPLGTANAALPVPDAPHLALWQALTTLREYRGDGHVAVLVGLEIDPCAAHVLAAASGRSPESDAKRYHKWTESQWSAALYDLGRRGWLRTDGTLSAAGALVRERIETDTDRLAARPYRELGRARTEELVASVRPVSDLVMAAGAVPVPNPVGFDWPPVRSGAGRGRDTLPPR